MVYEWGMSERMGPVKYTEAHDSAMGHEEVVAVSAITRRELDEEVRRIIDQQYATAKSVIEANRDKLERVAKALLEHETLDAVQVKKLMAGEELPPRRPTVLVPAVRTPEPKPEPPAAEAGDGGLKPQLA
jgi:cell division protease FtsH